jgi:deoxyribodipyrimidine photolyase-related protein
LRNWASKQSQPVNFLEDNRFLASRDEFETWASGRKQYRMEFFYREMRRKTGLLMEGDEPIGGKWNFDAENRKKLPKGHLLPARLAHQYDQDTRDVFAMVEREFANNFGSLDAFFWPVTDNQAQQNLTFFLDNCLENFGDYQDAMKQDQSLLYHSLIATSLNLGLLDPVETCRQAEQRYHDGAAPLNAVEGFIRQIIGWREYIRGIYWHFMPDYKALNFFETHRPLPAFYYTGDSQMNCMDQAVQTTHDFAYAHHIQRLMVTGNFALLAGLDPAQVNQWYLEVYADAYEWVELPNTHGMALFADGGVVASKPYAASGAYINRMSDYCSNCKYDVKSAYGDGACPFNFLYWNFMIEQEPRLSNNPRMGMVYRNLEKMDDEKRVGVQIAAETFLNQITTKQPVD